MNASEWADNMCICTLFLGVSDASQNRTYPVG